MTERHTERLVALQRSIHQTQVSAHQVDHERRVWPRPRAAHVTPGPGTAATLSVDAKPCPDSKKRR